VEDKELYISGYNIVVLDISRRLCPFISYRYFYNSGVSFPLKKLGMNWMAQSGHYWATDDLHFLHLAFVIDPPRLLGVGLCCRSLLCLN